MQHSDPQQSFGVDQVMVPSHPPGMDKGGGGGQGEGAQEQNRNTLEQTPTPTHAHTQTRWDRVRKLCQCARGLCRAHMDIGLMVLQHGRKVGMLNLAV